MFKKSYRMLDVRRDRNVNIRAELNVYKERITDPRKEKKTLERMGVAFVCIVGYVM